MLVAAPESSCGAVSCDTDAGEGPFDSRSGQVRATRVSVVPALADRSVRPT